MHECPPYLYLFQVAEHCPKAVATYMAIWNDKDKNNKLHLLKKDIRMQYLTSYAKFHDNLILLAKEGLINLHETPSVFKIEFVPWEKHAEWLEEC